MATRQVKPRIAVHKFSSCDGCQLAFLNLGEDLLALNEIVDIVHFAEAGMLDDTTSVDIAFIEGSISTAEDIERIRTIRDQSQHLITIGACATAGGLQALRNLAHANDWLQAIYPTADYIDSLEHVTPISTQVHVDFELWGCPINQRQLVTLIRALLWNVLPDVEQNKVCLECKRQQQICVMVTQATPCMGPVTRSGCGALCPSVGRGCYGCYGPGENRNTTALGQRFEGFGLLPNQIANQFLAINNQAEPFTTVGKVWKDKP
ncbi:MAG: sulfhydrogenase subunit delta [Halobacteria archaeon]|nr:sulfhydrogenase subunit delta [Halobacteria archaeon]